MNLQTTILKSVYKPMMVLCSGLCLLLILVSSTNATDRSFKLDFDGDGKADIAVYRPGQIVNFQYLPSYWYILESRSGQIRTVHWGRAHDSPAAGDFDGDGLTDLSVFRYFEDDLSTIEHNNYLLKSSQGFEVRVFGNPSTTHFVRDYYGTGRGQLSEVTVQYVMDPITFDSNTRWDYSIQLEGGQGMNNILIDDDCFNNCFKNYLGAPGDYDGNGATDAAVLQIGSAAPKCFHVWFSPFSSTTPTLQCFFDIDYPTPGDYDNDGMTDYAGYKKINGSLFWRIKYSSTGAIGEINWGLDGDKAVPADYDGDGKTDIAVFRPSNATWYIIRSSDNGLTARVFGLSNDIPIAEPVLTQFY